MIQDKLLANAVTKLIEKPYYLGDESKGWDCLNSLKQVYEECGLKFPRSFKDWNEANYRQKWMEDVENGRSTFVEFLQTLGTRVDKNFIVRGDLIILRHEKLAAPMLDSDVISRLKKIIARAPFMKKFINDVIAGRQLLTFPAIYLGNGNMFLIFTSEKDDKGPRAVPYRFFEKWVVEVRRLG